jgi:uncharacterized protein YutE (UPF0331/DUF86 family)
MIADREIVEERISHVRRYAQDLRQLSDIGREQFLKNTERQYAVLHALQLAIEASIEIATHICSADSLGAPSSYAEAFDMLEKAGILTGPLAEKLRSMARFRNRIVHLYHSIDLNAVYDILQNNLTDFHSYLATIENYLGQ